MKQKNILIALAFTLLAILTACNAISSNATIPVKAAIIYNLGGAQPVARTKLYLLKEDVTLKDKSFYLEPMIARAVGMGIVPGIQEEKIKDLIVSETTTDFEGNAKFENVPASTYYIVGFTRTRNEDGYAVWNKKVEAKKNMETVFLDQNSALKFSNNGL